MSLRAVAHSQYKKAGKTILTYKVFGSVAELQKYLEIQAAAIGKTPEEWMRSEDKDNAPLYFVSASNELRFGRLPKSDYTLNFKRDGSGVFVDTQADDFARWKRIQTIQETEMGKMLANTELGQATTPVVRTAPAMPAVQPTTEAEKLIHEMEGDNAAPAVQLAKVAEGPEGLGD